jgi:hypothetical protein
VQAFSQNAVGRCSWNSSRMCNFFTCHSAVFLQDLEHTFHTLVISRCSGSFSMLNLPSRKRWAQCEIVLRSTVSTPHTFISELWISIAVFPCNVSSLMYACWSSLVTVPDTQTAVISTLCRFHVHMPTETKYTAPASKSSPVQLLKWQDRWHHYLRSVANVCISFEITLVLKNVQSHSIIRHQHVTVTPVTVIWVAYNKNTVNIQISVQKYMIQPLGVTFYFKINCNIIHFLTIFVYWLYSSHKPLWWWSQQWPKYVGEE